MSRHPLATIPAARPVQLTDFVDPDAVAAATRGPAEVKLFESFADRHGYDLAIADAEALGVALAHRVWAPMIAAASPATSRRLGQWASLVTAVTRKALADRTHGTYRSAWRQFVFWAQLHGVDPLAATADDVVVFLVWAACATDGTAFLVDDDGEPLAGSCRPRTLGSYLSAIDRVRRALGQDPVGHLPEVADARAGLQRHFGLALENRKEPLGLDLLVEVLALLADETDDALRDRVVVGLWAAGVAPATIARLDWDDLDVGSDLVLVAPRWSTKAPVRITDAAVVDATAAWRARTGAGPVTAVPGPAVRTEVVEHLDAALPDLFALAPVTSQVTTSLSRAPGRGLTRPGVVKVIRRVLAAAGASVPDGAACPKPGDVDPAATRAAVTEPSDHRSLADVRDAALVTTAFYTAMRRINLADATWSRVRFEADRILWRVGPTKTNPGEDPSLSPAWLLLPPSPDPDQVPCPVKALRAWRAAVTDLIGADPVTAIPDGPVFFPVNRHGQPLVLDATGAKRWLTGETAAPVELAAMSGDAICELVQRLVLRTGRDQARYGAHSTRAGFVTEAAEAGLTHAQIKEVTGHRHDESVDAYIRANPRRANNPIAQLLANSRPRRHDPTRP